MQKKKNALCMLTKNHQLHGFKHTNIYSEP